MSKTRMLTQLPASRRLLLLLTLWPWLQLTTGDVVCVVKEGSTCLKVQEVNLTRLDGGQVNNSWKVPWENGEMTVRTISAEPLIMDISNLLSEEECHKVIEVAKEVGLTKSKTTLDTLETKWDAMKTKENVPDKHKKAFLLSYFRQLNATAWRTKKGVEFNDIADELGIKTDEQGNPLSESLTGDRLESLRDRLKALMKLFPEMEIRRSNSVSLTMAPSFDKFYNDIARRLELVTQLSPLLFSKDWVQVEVVHYKLGDFFKTHFDETEHCGTGERAYCRYLSVLVYLNDVEVGGETTFPSAENHEKDGECAKGGQCTTDNVCGEDKTLVKPEQGKAVFWYNFLPDPEGKDIGRMDPRMVHAGCPLRYGEKWLLTLWLTVPNYASFLEKTGVSVSEFVAVHNEASDARQRKMEGLGEDEETKAVLTRYAEMRKVLSEALKRKKEAAYLHDEL